MKRIVTLALLASVICSSAFALTPIVTAKSNEPRPKGRGMIWGEFRTPTKFGVELPGPKGPGFRGLDESYCNNIKVVSIFSLTEQDLNELMQGKNPEVAVEFPSNTVLPLNIFLKGDLINLVENEQTDSMQLEVKQLFYVRCVEGELLFSSNLSEWKTFLEFVTGTASVGLGIQSGQTFMMVGAEANLRQ